MTDDTALPTRAYAVLLEDLKTGIANAQYVRHLPLTANW
jgi:hypothetical protein